MHLNWPQAIACTTLSPHSDQRGTVMSEHAYPVMEQRFKRAYQLFDHLMPTAEKWVQSEYIFRGQDQAKWPLVPSLYRPSNPFVGLLNAGGITYISDQIRFEKRIIKCFLDACDVSGVAVPGYTLKIKKALEDPESYIGHVDTWPPGDRDDDDAFQQILAVMQHHGSPTRLLDWTRRPFVALYFAASTALRRKADAQGGDLAIWALPVDNSRAWRSIKVIEMTGATSVNLAAQSGLFTMQVGPLLAGRGTTARGLEEEKLELSSATRLHKFTLPASEAGELLKLCWQFGVTAPVLFPGLDGISRHVTDAGHLEALSK